MNRLRTNLITLLLFAAIGVVLDAAAQNPSEPRVPQSPAAPGAEAVTPPAVETPVEAQVERSRSSRPALRIGQDYVLKEGDAVREVAVIFGSATIEGRVERDVVVVLGSAQLSDTASIGGSLVVIGGTPTVTSGARVDEDVVVVGGGFDAPAGFVSGGQHIVIGPALLGGSFEGVIPWITRGLLWGRPIVPALPWVWGVVAIFFLVYLALNAVFDQPVRGCVETLAEKPLTAFMVGLLVLLLTGPVSLLLAVSVIGIAVVPFVLCALFVAWLIGRVAVMRWIGMRAVPQESPESRMQSLRSFTLGFAVICVAYVVPVLGFVVWTMVGVFGLGAATLAFIAAFRREQPRTPDSREIQEHGRVPSGGPVPGYGPHPEASAVPPQPPALAGPEGTGVSFSPPATSIAAAPPDIASFPHAGFLERAAAFGLDVILVVIAQEMLDLTRRDSAIFLLLLAYHIGFWTWKGTTVGGIICQLRVVRVDGAPLRFVDALVRGLSSIFSLAVLGLGAFWILIDPERQAWHDKIAGTYVVKVPRNWPL